MSILPIFLSLFFLNSSLTRILAKDPNPNCQQDLINQLTGPHFKENTQEDMSHDMSETEMIQETCPGMQMSCCSSQELDHIMSIFDTNLDNLRNLKDLMHNIVEQIYNLGHSDRMMLLNELKNSQQFEINNSDPMYIRFVSALDYVMNNHEQIQVRIESSFRFSSELNAAYACALCEQSNQQQISLLKSEKTSDGLIPLSFNFDTNNCKEMLFRTEAYLLLQFEADLNEIYNVMTPLSAIVSKTIPKPLEFIAKDQLPSLKIMLEKCQSVDSFSTDPECTGLCLRLGFNNDSLFHFIDKQMMAFKIILDNRQMALNQITSDENDIEQYNELKETCLFDSFLISVGQSNYLKDAALTLQDGTGFNLINYLNSPFDIFQKMGYNEYPLNDGQSESSERRRASLNLSISQCLSFKTKEFDRERASQPTFEMSFSLKQIEQDNSVNLVLLEIYNHSHDSISIHNKMIVLTDQKRVNQKDMDEDTFAKTFQNNRTIVIN